MPSRKIAGFLALALVLVAGLLPVSAGAQAEPDLVLTLRLSGGSNLPLGAPLRFELEVRNTTNSAKNGLVDFGLRPVGKPSEGVLIERWNQAVPANATIVHRGDLHPGQFFAATGAYELWGQSFYPLEPVTFEITPSPIRIPTFRDVAAEVGLSTSLSNFTCGTWSAGAAWADIDGDGDLDLFLPRRDLPSQLFVNHGGHFVDEAVARGITGNGLGAVFVDYDNDGDQDLFVAHDGIDQLYRNDGTGHFEEIAQQAGVATAGASQSISFGDFDNDGFVDMYVARHVQCTGQAERTYFDDVLYRNKGDGTFGDYSHLLSRTAPLNGAGFTAVWFDYDNDGDLDLYLANDYYGNRPLPNFMWRNNGPKGDGEDWRFNEVSLQAGTRISMNSMGLAIGDYDRNGHFDIGISNIYETILFRNRGNRTFTDVGAQVGVDRPLQDLTQRSITWGTGFADLNNNGWEDLYVPAGRLGGETRQPNALFTNRKGKFWDQSIVSGTADLGVSRGVAFADYDRDGLMDMFLVNQDGTPRMYKNITKKGKSRWLQVLLRGRKSNRDACGARLIATVKKAKLHRQIFCGGTSLGSGSDKAAYFGLGNAKRVKKLVIKWPSGRKTVLKKVKPNRRIVRWEPKK